MLNYRVEEIESLLVCDADFLLPRSDILDVSSTVQHLTRYITRKI